MLTINPINNNYQPQFGTYFHTVKDTMGNIVYRGDTRFFRDDINWNKLVDYISHKYKDNPDVQIIMHACSNGEEAYSLIATLLTRLGEKSEKFFPIIAKDIDPVHIALAKKGVYEFTSVERPNANFYTQGNFNKYFYEQPKGRYSIVEPKEFLKNKVQFEIGDAVADAKNLSLKNKIVFARNFMPYLGRNKAYEYVEALAKNSDETTTLVIGGFDKEFCMDTLLYNCGFKPTGTSCVYRFGSW